MFEKDYNSDMSVLLNEIDKVKLKEKEENALTSYNAQIKSLDKALADENVIVEDEAGIRLGITEEYNNKMKIANWENSQEVTKISKQTQSKLNSIQAEALARKLELSDEEFNDDVINARSLLDAKLITEEEFQEMLTEITRKQSIARLQIVKAEKQARIDSGDATKEETAKLILEINALDAAIAKLIGSAASATEKTKLSFLEIKMPFAAINSILKIPIKCSP